MGQGGDARLIKREWGLQKRPGSRKQQSNKAGRSECSSVCKLGLNERPGLGA